MFQYIGSNLGMATFQSLITLIRANEWWSYKLASVLGTAYATAVILELPLISLWNTLLFLLIALVIGAAYANIINNLSDREVDQICDKANSLVGKSNWFVAMMLAILNLSGLVIAELLVSTPLALGLYIGNWFLFAAYSLPPLRLKERGIWGALANATADTCVPHLLAVLLVAYNGSQVLVPAWIPLIAIWSLAAGLRGILWHQICDFENDQRASINTFAVSTSIETLEKFGRRFVFPIELISFLGILALCHSVLPWILLSLHLTTEWLRHYFWQLNIEFVGSASSDRLALCEYYEVFYPLGFLCLAVLHRPDAFIILMIHLLLYHHRLWWWIRDFWGIFRWEIPRKFQQQLH